MKKIALFVVLASMLTLTIGCDGNNEDPKFKFINRSSHTVIVRPAKGELHWQAFPLGPGQSLTLKGDSRYFFEYSPEWAVKPINEKGRVIFVNEDALEGEASI